MDISPNFCWSHDIEAYNELRLELIDDLVTHDYVDHINKVGREGLKQLFTMGLAGFLDWHETIERHSGRRRQSLGSPCLHWDP